MSRLSPYNQLSDEELVHRYRNSYDLAYVGELYLRYTHLVYGVCLKHFKDEAAARDATMQIFEKLISDLKRHHVVAFKPWLHSVVRNYCLMQFRTNATALRRQQEYRQEVQNEPGFDVENQLELHLETADEKEWLLAHLNESIDELREEQRTCIELFYLKGNSYQEISQITGYSLNEVKSYIQNGKRNLKNLIIAKHERAKKK
jgi:RNA polymerase sigma-70 factor (ECF subfamily)